MKKEIEIPDGCEARIEGNKVVFVPKEREDERITAEIVDFIQRNAERGDDIMKSAGWIAYLERQKDEAQKQFDLGIQAGKEEALYEMEKEQKPAELSEDERIMKELIDYFRDPSETKVTPANKFKEWYAWLVRQKEYIEDVRQYAYNKGIVDTEEKLKPAEWSEEDEKKLSAVLFSISRFGGEEHLKTKGYKYAEISNWLKSLRPRPNWKPSDEDEERLINTSISFLKDFADKGYENAVECIDWLKSKLNGNSGK